MTIPTADREILKKLDILRSLKGTTSDPTILRSLSSCADTIIHYSDLFKTNGRPLEFYLFIDSVFNTAILFYLTYGPIQKSEEYDVHAN